MFRWNKLVQKPYEEGDERGLKLVQSILKPIMLRRTKNSTDNEGRYVQLLWFILSFAHLCRVEELYKLLRRRNANRLHFTWRSLHSIKQLSPLHMNNLFGTWLTCMLLCRPILNLPPANIEVKYCDLSEAEKDFYEALFRRSKVTRFNW